MCLTVLSAPLTGLPVSAAESEEDMNARVVDLLGQGKFAEAEPIAEKALSLAEKSLGPGHPDVATSLNNLAEVYRFQGRYAEAEPLYKRALATIEKSLGPDHPNMGRSLGNLGALYTSQGRYPKAEPLYKRSLAILEKSLGPEDPDVATSLNNLAGLYELQGRYAEAEPLCTRALAILEESLGPGHPAEARPLNTLALLYHYQGRYADAELLYKRVLAIQEESLGPRHPAVARSLNNLAGLYESQSRYADVEPWYKLSLAIREESLGPGHPDVANSLANLAALYGSKGRYAEAEPLYKRSLAILEKSLGPGHPAVALSLNNLATLYRSQGRYAEAEPLCKRSLAIWEESLGPDNADVALSLINLAELYGLQGRDVEELATLERGLRQLARASAVSSVRSDGVPGVPVTVDLLRFLSRAYAARAAGESGWRELSHAALLGVDVVERLRAAHGAEERKTADLSGGAGGFRSDSMRIGAQYHELFAWSALAELRLERPRGAFEVWERGLARGMLELASQAGLKGLAGVVPAVPARERELEGRLSKAREEDAVQRAGPDETKKTAAAQALHDLEAEYAAFLKEVEARHPDYFALRHPRPGKAESVQAALKPGEVLVEYAVLSSSVAAAFIVGSGRFEVVELPEGEEGLRRLVERVRAPLGQVALGALKPKDLEDLYRAVFEPVERVIAAWPENERPRTLQVVPSGPLVQLPFEALVAEQGGRAGRELLYGDWERAGFLAERYAMAYWPSASVFLLSRERGKPAKAVKKLIAFADPVFGPEESDREAEGRLKALAGSAGMEGILAFASGGRRGARGFPLDRLADSAEEAAAAGRALGQAPDGEWLKVREGADEGELMRLSREGKLKDYRYLLVSTHGLQPSDLKALGEGARTLAKRLEVSSNPGPKLAFARSLADKVGWLKEPAVALTLRPEEPSEGDGFLTMGEIFGLDLDAELAVLSACVTGLGERVAGEGVLGMTRGLMYAGARTTMTSLWYVESRTTARLVSRVLAEAGNRKVGEAVSSAVNRARLAVARGEAIPIKVLERGRLVAKQASPAHPFFWAPFVLYGDWR